MRPLLFILVISLFTGLLSFSFKVNQPSISDYQPEKTLKEQAFEVLDNNCNECHIEKKEDKYIFTLENMDSHAAKINMQVFIKKKMPKGEENALSETDSTILKNWINAKFGLQ